MISAIYNFALTTGANRVIRGARMLATLAPFADEIAVLKPQSAFFEAYGSRGVAVLERLIADARSANASGVRRGAPPASIVVVSIGSSAPVRGLRTGTVTGPGRAS